MAKDVKKSGMISHGIAAQNRKGRFDYTIKETVEAGIVLKGPEVKSLRLGRATITEAYAAERDGALWMFNCYIPEYQGGVLSRFEPRAPRKLLLHNKQIDKMLGEVKRSGFTLGLGEGRKNADKREAIAARDWQRDKARLLRDRG